MTDSHYPTAKPIVPWIGGKRRLAKHILPWFEPHTCYVEPFAGAAAMLFAKTPSKVEVLNDINSDLVNLYRVVQHHLEELVRQFKWALTSRQVFTWVQSTPPETLTDIQRAARFLYLQMLCFGAKVEGRTFGVATTTTQAINLLRLEENLSAAHLRLSQVVVEYMDWQACIRRYDRPHTLFYCRPTVLGHGRLWSGLRHGAVPRIGRHDAHHGWQGHRECERCAGDAGGIQRPAPAAPDHPLHRGTAIVRKVRKG